MSALRCVTCKRAVRPQGTLAKDHPGTVVIAHHGMCWVDYRAAKARGEFKTAPKPPPTERPAKPLDPVREKALHDQRARFEADRRARGVPPEGTFSLRKRLAA